MDSAFGDFSNPTWAKGLKRSGLYFDGFVDDIESVLEQHRKDTVTFYGTRNSSGAEQDNSVQLRPVTSESLAIFSRKV